MFDSYFGRRHEAYQDETQGFTQCFHSENSGLMYKDREGTLLLLTQFRPETGFCSSNGSSRF